MKLIKIETKGFKSFADKTTLTFDGSVIGIVGPNGSGKSNINDAIKWVLGEQSIKSLRGDSSDDVIFSGSKTIPASNEAEVSLTFDNTDKKVSLPHSKIVISRVVKRGGGSNVYYVNGEEARLKDIKEIAMESGIGKSSLAIISQGTISDIAEATPEQRRGIFEEAAGISKYKARKREALRKLDSTTDALDKIKTVINELEKQLLPLKRQSEKAKIFLDKKSKLKNIEISLIIRDVNFFTKKLSELQDKLEGVEEQKSNLEGNISKLENNIDKKTSDKLKHENEIISLSEEYQILSNKIRDIEISESRISERRQMVIDGEIKSNDATRVSAMKEELEDLSKKIRKYKNWEINSRSDIADKKASIVEMQSKVSSMNFDIDNNRNKLLKLTTKLSILKDNKKNKSNLFKGVKTIIENKNLFPGCQGIVSELLTVDDKFKPAIESVLQSAFQHIVVEKTGDAVKAVKFLKENRGGRATFIPLSSIRPKGIIEEHQMVLENISGFLGRASELIQTDIKFDILKKFLLGNILVVETIEDAKKIGEIINNRYMIVTLDGDLIRAGGVISGGERSRSKDMLGIDEQINKIQDVVPKLEELVESKKAELLSFNNSSSEDLAIIAELNIETAKVIEKRTIAEKQFLSLKASYEEQTKKKFVSKEKGFDEDANTLNEQKISAQTLLRAKRGAVMNINNELASSTIQKTEFEKTLRHLIESSSDQLTDKAQAEYVVKSSKNRLSEEYEMTIESAQENFAKDINEEEAREIVSSLRSDIKELGNVNVDSIQLFEEVNERFTTLDTSREELFSAQQIIISAINDMDQIIISKLDETVKSVNEEFNNVFTKMFGGGLAEVRYTNPGDLLETGIDVIARPPGKTVRNLKLFSGGEKALIAISLLFAILKSKPLPLCILDEVEAALDDANVVRFADYLQELKKQTQFLVITHRVGTMARVDVLFGATMQNRGVTSFFSVKLDDAKKLVD